VDYGNPKPCVAVLIQRGRRLLLARRAIEPAKGMWDIPGGFIEGGESVEKAVKREVLEETALRLKNIQYIGSVADTYADSTVGRIPTLNLCFIGLPRVGREHPGSDVAQLCWFLPDELPRQQLAFSHQQEVLKKWTRKSFDLLCR